MSTAIAVPPIRRPVLRYHGGKFRLAPKLIEIFPPHRVYTEAFGGGASVLLLKPRSYAEIYNDLDGEVVNVFRVLQDRKKAKRLEELLRVTPFAREEFLLSYEETPGAHTRKGVHVANVERARRTIIRSFMGFGSDSISRMKMSTGFRWSSMRSGTSPATDWRHYPDMVRIFCERLQGVAIEQRDAKSILTKMDKPEALHYVDPPYPKSVRKIGNGSTPEHRYKFEMDDADHEELAALLLSLKGMVIISSYPSLLYEQLFQGWKQMEWTGGQFSTDNKGGAQRTEVVWLNEAAWKGSRRRLFD